MESFVLYGRAGTSPTDLFAQDSLVSKPRCQEVNHQFGVRGQHVQGREDQFSVAGSIHEQLTALLSMMNSLVSSLKPQREQTMMPVERTINDSVLGRPSAIRSVSQESSISAEELKTYPALSNKKPGEKPSNVFTGVTFSERKNEPVLSAVKAAMMKFGQSPLSVYRRVTRTPEGYSIVMRDGVKVNVSLNEIARAKAFSGFALSKERGDAGMRKDLIFMFAASAKRVQLESASDKPKSYNEAIDVLNAHPRAEDALKRLGLVQYMQLTTAEDLRDNGHIGVIEVGGNTNLTFGGYRDGCTLKQPIPAPNHGASYKLI